MRHFSGRGTYLDLELIHQHSLRYIVNKQRFHFPSCLTIQYIPSPAEATEKECLRENQKWIIV